MAGCRVMTGTLVRGRTLYKVLRNNNTIFEGELRWYVWNVRFMKMLAVLCENVLLQQCI